jgi:hypothetical protein
MKKILTFLFDFASARRASEFHDDTLRANQGCRRAAFGPWRALIGG